MKGGPTAVPSGIEICVMRREQPYDVQSLRQARHVKRCVTVRIAVIHQRGMLKQHPLECGGIAAPSALMEIVLASAHPVTPTRADVG
jgi:hypothetical protein